MNVPSLHPDKLRSVQQALDPKRKKKAKPPEPGLMANLAAQMYANREAQQRRRRF